jgi:hypothetical protein
MWHSRCGISVYLIPLGSRIIGVGAESTMVSFDMEERIMARTVVGSFDSFEQARRAVDDLALHGFNQNDISILASNIRGEHRPEAAMGTETTTAEAIGVGAVTGGVLGGAPGLAAGMVGLAIPGVGPIIAAGSLAAALAGAGAGAVAGGLIGGLTQLGIPEEQAQHYAESVRRGGALVTVVKLEDREAERAAQIMRGHGAVDIDERAAQWRAGGWTGFAAAPKP